jgi:hypothetical protein
MGRDPRRQQRGFAQGAAREGGFDTREVEDNVDGWPALDVGDEGMPRHESVGHSGRSSVTIIDPRHPQADMRHPTLKSFAPDPLTRPN